MNEQESLLAAIAADPLDNTVKLAYADWLMEHDYAAEAAAMRRGVHHHSPFESLIGRTVNRVRFVDSTDQLLIYTLSGIIGYTVEGDCCSISWFYRVLNPQNLIGEKVICVMEGCFDDLDPEDGLGRQESESFYAYSIVTAKGVCEVTFRNSSNGYYGGWMTAQHDPEVTNETFIRELEESWTYPPVEKMVCSRPSGKDCGCEECLIKPSAK